MGGKLLKNGDIRPVNKKDTYSRYLFQKNRRGCINPRPVPARVKVKYAKNAYFDSLSCTVCRFTVQIGSKHEYFLIQDPG